jgi:glycosyltransferase involved in cell wall biosynthesis
LPSIDRAEIAAEANASRRVFVACPDARPPAYEAVAGLARARKLDAFQTGFYYGGAGRLSAVARQWFPCHYVAWRRRLKRRHHARIPVERVRADWGFDLALAVESRLARRVPRARRAVGRWRTERFDRLCADRIERSRPNAAFVFSDVASRCGLPTCRRLGIPSVLSMVHGDVREEREVLKREAERSPDFFPIYLADGPIDWNELNWLHERRLRDIALADRILVPSSHISDVLANHGTPQERITVVPYAADTNRFRPSPNKKHTDSCTFLFTGGIVQRKGIKYLLEAWRKIRRRGWQLQLLGAPPQETRPL